MQEGQRQFKQENRCQHCGTSWLECRDKDRDVQISRRIFTMYCVGITTEKYNESHSYLEKNNSTAIIHEIYGKYDFWAEVFFSTETNNGGDAYSEIKKYEENHSRQINSTGEACFYQVLEIFKYNRSKGGFDLERSDDLEEYNFGMRNMINAFILLEKRKTEAPQAGPSLTPKEILDSIGNRLDAGCRQFVFRAYVMKKEDARDTNIENEHQSLMLYLNIDCKDIGKLNAFTTEIDKIVDANIYEKTTLISTKKTRNNEAIKAFEQREQRIPQEAEKDKKTESGKEMRTDKLARDGNR